MRRTTWIGDSADIKGATLVACATETLWNAIVSMQTAAAAGGSLHAGSAAGPQLTLLPLPYALLEDI